MTRPARPLHRTLGALLLASALSIAGCSSNGAERAGGGAPTTDQASTSSLAGEIAAFCGAGETINARTAAIAGPEDAVAAFTELDPTLDDMLESAPPEVADEADEFVSIARSAVESGDFSPFEDGTVGALTKRFDAVCSEG